MKKSKKKKTKTGKIKNKKVSKNVDSSIDEYWEFFSRTKVKISDDISGKYLFFSKDRNALRQIAIDEIEKYNFYTAKVSVPSRNTDFVLCLYYKDDSRKKELYARYAKLANVKYRHWKSDFDTAVGNYSQQYIDSLPAAQKEDVVSRKEMYNPDRQQEINKLLSTLLVRKTDISKIKSCPDEQLSKKQKNIIALLQKKKYNLSKWIIINDKQLLLVSSSNDSVIVDFAKPNEIGTNKIHFPILKIPKDMQKFFDYTNKQVENDILECWMDALHPTS